MPQVERPANNSKWERINTLYELLQRSCEGLSIQTLSKQMNVSSKTIQRDLYEVLGDYGAIKQGRLWKIDPKRSRDNLNSNERIILGILDEMAKNAGHSFYAKAHSLLKQVSQELEHPIFTHIASETLDEKHIALFSSLEKALKSQCAVGIQYKKHTFKIKPLKLVFFDGFWYLLALDMNDEDKFKKFHLKSISALIPQEDIFEIDTELEERLAKANSIWFDLDNDLFDVHLFMDKKIMTYFERKPLKGQSIVGKDSDGSCEVVVSITHEMEIIPLIFRYMPHIKVLEPEWIAKIVKEQIQAYLKSISA